MKLIQKITQGRSLTTYIIGVTIYDVIKFSEICRTPSNLVSVFT